MANIQTCLADVIGIDRQCTAANAPSSGLFLQDLPGIELRVADAAVNAETESGVALMQEKIDFAKNAVVQDMRTFLLPLIRSDSILANSTIGFYEPNREAVALEVGLFKGIRLEIRDLSYFEVIINSVTLFLDSVVTTDINVIDLIEGRILTTDSITTVANQRTELVINRSFTSRSQRMSLLIAIDSGVAGTFKSSINRSTLRRGCTNCPHQVGATWSDDFLDFSSVSISQGDTLIDDNTNTIQNTNGVSFNYSLGCIVDPIICNMSNQLAWPILHRAGAELLKEIKYSTGRLNSVVTVKASNMEALRKEFEEEYTEKMDQIVDNMTIPNNICFDCRDTVKNVTQIP